MADPIITNGELITMTDVIAYVQAKLTQESVLAASLTDVSSYAQAGQSSIDFPIASAMVVKKKAIGGKTEGQSFTMTSDKMNLDQHAYVRYIIEKRAMIQAATNVNMDALDAAIVAQTEEIDNYLYSLLAAGAAHSVAFTGAGTKIAVEDIISANQKIKATKVPSFKGNMFLAVNSIEEAVLLGLDGFIDSSKYGSNEVLVNGEIGKISGTKILVTESVAAGKPVQYHKLALNWGLQAIPQIMKVQNLDYIGEETLIDWLYGAKLMRSGVFAAKLNP